MEPKHVKDLLPEYLDNLLDQAQREKIETHLIQCASCAKELAELKILFSALEEEESAIPSNSIRVNFLQQLEIEKQNMKKVIPIGTASRKDIKYWTGNILKLAASIALLIGSYMLGSYRQQLKSNLEMATIETENLNFKQTAMISLMENKSASRRIQGVDFIEEFENPDETILNALSERMLHDENTNVRLAATEALGRFAAFEKVKNKLITALETEKDPSMQITIIQLLVKIQEKKAFEPMRKLMEQEDTQPFVKKEINQILSQII